MKALRVLTGENVVLEDYQPRSALRVHNTPRARAKFGAIDMHFHLASLSGIDSAALVKAMDAAGVDRLVNLDGFLTTDGSPSQFDLYKRDFKDRFPDRFIMFATLNAAGIGDGSSVRRFVDRLQQAVDDGAQGLKVHKNLGLTLTDTAGKLVSIDDERGDDIWSRAGDLGIPVLLHVTDPTPFFQPVDRFNERYEELKAFPDWSFHGPRFPSKETLLNQRENLLRKHPNTIFVGAHMGDNPEDLTYVGKLLDRYPNYYVDIAARLPELGRQPFTSRDFFISTRIGFSSQLMAAMRSTRASGRFRNSSAPISSFSRRITSTSSIRCGA